MTERDEEAATPSRKGLWAALSRAKPWAIPASLVTALSILAGSAIGLLVVPRAPEPTPAGESAIVAEFLGERLEMESALETGRQRLQDYTARTFTLTIPDAPSVTHSLDKWGVSVDEERLESLLLDARDASSPLRRHFENHPEDSSEDAPSILHIPLPVSIEGDVAVSELLRIKARFDQRPTDAKLDIASGKVKPHVDGRYLDVDATLFSMEQALKEGKLTARAIVMKESPRVVAAKLQGLKFSEVLGHFETRYSREEKYEDRTFNLSLAASKLDGTVLMPGEIFDFNEVVGPRDEANGYKVATVIADGELVDGIGGGTCQISGTLHGAAFFAGLGIVERYPHTRPSSYIKMGMDATVVYPTINFRFENTYEFPVALHQVVEGGTVRAEILGPTQDQVVTLIRKVTDVIPYEQLERSDASMPRGTRSLAQRGIPGFRLHRYRVIRRGSHTKRERWRDVYPPTAQVIRVGTGEATLEKKPSVSTPEYLADEVLILTQRRPEGGKPGEMAENREAGKYGSPGWTKEAGMPFWAGD